MILAELTCDDFRFITNIINLVIKLIKFAVPIVLIVLVVIDMAKAVSSNDEKTMNDSKQRSLKRILYAVILFLVPTLVEVLVGLIPLKNDEYVNITFFLNCINGKSTKIVDIPEPKKEEPKKEEPKKEEPKREEPKKEEPKTTTVAVSSVGCKEVNIKLKVNEEYNLGCEVFPSNATNKLLTYNVSNDKISVSNGIVRGLKLGNSSIIVTSNNNKQYKVNVTIYEEKEESIRVNTINVKEKNIVLYIGEEKLINYSIDPYNATNKLVYYTNYNSNIISIKNNKILALREGKTIITVNCDSKKEYINVTVNKKVEEKTEEKVEEKEPQIVDVCKDDKIKPELLVTGDYIYKTKNSNNKYSDKEFYVLVETSDNCSKVKTYYKLNDGNEVLFTDKILIKETGINKLTIKAKDEKNNVKEEIYYTYIKEDIYKNYPHTCYTGYYCSEGFYKINYDELLGSCYKDSKVLLVFNKRKLIGSPNLKFYSSLTTLNDDIISKKAGLVNGWDSMDTTPRYMYKCNVDCSNATINTCLGYGYYNPTNNQEVIDKEAADTANFYN